MVAAKNRPAKKRAVTTAKLNVTKTPAAKKTARPRMPSGQSPQIAVPPATYPWLHFSTVRTAGGTVSDPDAVAAVERQFEQWRRGLQRETRSAAQAAVGSRARHEAETIGFCADAILDAMRLIHLMRFATHDDRGTPRAKVVDKECTRLEEATIGWKYHADGPFIGLFPVQTQPITFRDISEDTFTAFAHLLACWHLEQIKKVRWPRVVQLREPELERLFELLAECPFRGRTETAKPPVLVTLAQRNEPDQKPEPVIEWTDWRGPKVARTWFPTIKKTRSWSAFAGKLRKEKLLKDHPISGFNLCSIHKSVFGRRNLELPANVELIALR